MHPSNTERRIFLRGLCVLLFWKAWPKSISIAGEAPAPSITLPTAAPGSRSNFKTVYDDAGLQREFYLFLQNVYHLYPEEKFHRCLTEVTKRYGTDREIYVALQKELTTIKPALAAFRYALPALAKQKTEMVTETVQILNDQKGFDGYVEIGTPGRYVRGLTERLALKGPVYLVHDHKPGFSPEDIMERGSLRRGGSYVPLGNYDPITSGVAENSVDLITNYIGFHHATLDRLEPFVRSIWKALRPGGTLVVRDHDVTSPSMDALVALAHDVFNAGLERPWDWNAAEFRHFRSVAQLEQELAGMGFESTGSRLMQPGDPTKNALLRFTKKV